MQTRAQSRREVFFTVLTGLIYAIGLNWILLTYPIFESQFHQAWWITLWFTVVSVIHKYWCRRFFNWWDNHDRSN